jgi:hypothetical protein
MRSERNQRMRSQAISVRASQRIEARFELMLSGPCAACREPGECWHRGLVLCRDCRDSARPNVVSDPYDDLGGGD